MKSALWIIGVIMMLWIGIVVVVYLGTPQATRLRNASGGESSQPTTTPIAATQRQVAYGDYSDGSPWGRYGPICPGCRNPVNSGSISCGRGCPAYRWVAGSCTHCDGKGMVTCRRCGGKGSYDSCHACDPWDWPASKRANCKHCGGTGKEPNHGFRCSDCGERGSHQCTFCSGVGRWS
ncbi:MAG: hypothetical protein WAP74_02835 [Patescibacteria group bacterium]